MRIDPANTAPAQSPIAYKLYNITVRQDRCLVHSLVVGQQLFAISLVSDVGTVSDELSWWSASSAGGDQGFAIITSVAFTTAVTESPFFEAHLL